MRRHFSRSTTAVMGSSGATRSLVSSVRWLLALSCVTCAVINRNEAVHSELHQGEGRCSVLGRDPVVRES